MSLSADLVEALEEMAESHDEMWGVWTHSRGGGPDAEMMTDCRPDVPVPERRGYSKWNKKIRERHNVAELERLFGL